MLSQIESFSANGGTFAKGIDIAKALVGLKQALAKNEAPTITLAIGTMRGLLEDDDGFQAARAAELAANEQSKKNAILAARQQAESLKGFLEAYVSDNITFEHIDELLKLREALASALTSGNADQILAAQTQATAAVQSYGLNSKFEQFVATAAAPTVTSDELAANVANERAGSLALENAISSAKQQLANVDSYAASGGSFRNGLKLARAVVALRQALVAPELGALGAAAAKVAEITEADDAFVTSQSTKAGAVQVAIADAEALARADAQSMNGFLVHFISANVGSPKVADLLDLQSALESALADNNGPRIINLAKDTAAKIDMLALRDTYGLHLFEAIQADRIRRRPPRRSGRLGHRAHLHFSA